MRTTTKKNNEKLKLLTVTDQAQDGRGIAHADGMTVFVRDAVIGQIVEARITEQKKRYALAEVVRVQQVSPYEVEPDCPYLSSCGGCAFGRIAYTKQLKIKEDRLRQQLRRIGGVSDPLVRPIIGAERVFRYRNKAVLAVDGSKVGFRAPKSHHVTDCRTCLLQTTAAEAVAEALRKTLQQHASMQGAIERMTVRTSFLSGDVVVILQAAEDVAADGHKRKERRGKSGGKGVARGKQVEPSGVMLKETQDFLRLFLKLVRKNLARENFTPGNLAQNDYSLKSVLLLGKAGNGAKILYNRDAVRKEKGAFLPQTAQPSAVQGVLHEGDRSAAGDLSENLCGAHFRFSYTSFFQIHHEQTEKLYRQVAAYAALDGTEDVLDMYCGVGSIGQTLLYLLKENRKAHGKTGKLIGIEYVNDAVKMAKYNADVNKCYNTVYYAGAAEEILPALLKSAPYEEEKDNFDSLATVSAGKQIPACDEEISDRQGETFATATLKSTDSSLLVAILDPPRRGCAPEFLEELVRSAPARIVYVSCDPATLSRDIRFLSARGYSFIEATPLDMFPRTGSLETVALLSHQEVEKTIYIEYEPKDNELIPYKDATYEEIKAWIKKMYGFNVTNLYIGQAKEKFGLAKRKNYNLSKKEDQVVPKCPEEKMEAIKEAFIHFKMIDGWRKK